MLVKCPECGKEISDQSDKCIYCGYPLGRKSKEDEICIINGKPCNLSEELELLKSNNFMQVLRNLRDKYGLELEDSVLLGKDIKSTKRIPKEYNSSQREEYRERIKELENTDVNTPRCPTCQSTNIKKISTTVKATNTVLFGLLGTKRHKTFHCNNCGYEW